MHHLIFVYGTLRKKGEFHQYLETAQFVDYDYVEGFVMLIAGDYPVIAASGNRSDRVRVEIYSVDDPTLKRIDLFEGYYGSNQENEYERTSAVSMKGHKGFIYTGTGSMVYSPENIITSGDWIEWQSGSLK